MGRSGDGGGPGGEGESQGEVVVGGAGLVGEAGEFFEDLFAGGEGGGDSQESGFEEDAEAGEEVAAGDEQAAVGIGGRVAAGGDRDGKDRGLEGELAEEFHDRGADAGSVDGERAPRAGRVAGVDGPTRGCGVGEKGREAAEEIKVREAEGETVGVAEAEDRVGAGLEGDRVGVGIGKGETLKEDEGGGVVAAAKVETVEEVRFGEGGDGFNGEDHGGRVVAAGAPGAGAPAEVIDDVREVGVVGLGIPRCAAPRGAHEGFILLWTFLADSVSVS